MKRHAVLIPSYNSVTTLGETLHSLLAQDLSSIDGVYLADDASADDTVEIARRVWQSTTPLFVLRREQNGGERRNVNGALGQLPAHVEWIHILHSDDIAKPHWLSTMVRHIDGAPATVASVCSSWDNLNGDGSVEPGENEPAKPAVHVDGSPEAIRSTLQKGCWWHISGCAIRLAAFGCRCTGVRRRTALGAPAGFTRVTSLELLERELPAADIVVLATPLTPLTRDVLSARRMDCLPPNAIVVNVARGALVDEAALADRLAAGRLRGAVLDVFAIEPLPSSSPLWGMRNALITPHVSAVSPRMFWERELELFLDNWARYREGRLLRNYVDKEAGY